MRFQPLALALAAVALVCAVAPDAAEAQPRRRDCGDERTQTEMNRCADWEFRAADADLNRIYGQLRARLDDKRREALTGVQRAWIRYRDAQCVFAALANEGGSLETYTRSTCLTRTTRARIMELRQALREAESR